MKMTKDRESSKGRRGDGKDVLFNAGSYCLPAFPFPEAEEDCLGLGGLGLI